MDRKRTDSSAEVYGYVRAQLRALLTDAVRVHRYGMLPNLVVPGGQAIAHADFGSPEHAALIAESVDEIMASHFAEELLSAMLRCVAHGEESERVRHAPPIADELEELTETELAAINPPPATDERWDDEDTKELTYEIDFSDLNDEPFNDPRDATRPGVNPLPARKSQRPTVRAADPAAMWREQSSTSRTNQSWPAPAIPAEPPTVRPPPPPRPRRKP